MLEIVGGHNLSNGQSADWRDVTANVLDAATNVSWLSITFGRSAHQRDGGFQRGFQRTIYVRMGRSWGRGGIAYLHGVQAGGHPLWFGRGDERCVRPREPLGDGQETIQAQWMRARRRHGRSEQRVLRTGGGGLCGSREKGVDRPGRLP
jgi:hypothetical protein